MRAGQTAPVRLWFKAAVVRENLCRNRGLIDSHKRQYRKAIQTWETPFRLQSSC